MKKVRILAIAPYKGLKDLILEVAKERNNLNVQAYVADMLEGVELVNSLDTKDYDCIISRAGTAELIRKVTTIPVIDIKISIIDMISAIKLAQNSSGSFVIVGFPSITEKADMISQINHESIETITVNSAAEIDDYLNVLKNKGVRLIVGDVITVSKAKNLGFNTILVTSGKESVLDSFDEVNKLLKLQSYYEQKNRLIEEIINTIDTDIIAFNNKKNVVFTNINHMENAFFETTKDLIELVFQDKKCEIIQQIKNGLFFINGQLFESNGGKFATFYIKRLKSPVKLDDPAITIINATDESKLNLETFTTNNQQFKNLLEDIKAYSKVANPLILIGEIGTGKDALAKAIYKNGLYNKNPFIIIDVKYMDKKKWINLFNEETSILTHSNITIYIKNLQMMNQEDQQLLESYFINTYIHKRNKFIFSYVSGQSDSPSSSYLLEFFRNSLGAFPLILPNLNDRKEDISSLASLFISDLITKYGKQVFGLEPKALELLKEFKWTNNIDQLKRIIEQCVILTDTDTYYISEETVQKVLANESIPNTETSTNIDLNKPLDEINKDIINLVLAEENYNQSKAAERLGISRSTLWRKLK